MAGSSATVLKSVQDAKKELRNFLKGMQTIPTEILKGEAKVLEWNIKAQIPYDQGKLLRSVRVSVAKDKRRPGINASASARDRGYNYAGIQHYNLIFRHKGHRKANYIKDPFEFSTRRIREKILRKLLK